MRRNIPLIRAVAVVALAAGLVACGASETDVQLVVQDNHRVLDRFTLSRLEQLPQVQVAPPQSHRVQQGPSVRSILDAAGATGVISVRVEGRDPAQTLTAGELDDRTILGFTKRHTLKLTGAKLSRDQWVRDVTELVVNP
jgi:type IV pilus biogenesis protein CpaD/CtpE